MKNTYIFLLFVMTGCATKNIEEVWLNNTKSGNETRKDHTECTKIAHDALDLETRRNKTPPRIYEDSRIHIYRHGRLLRLASTCMEQRGYRRNEDR